MIKFDDSFSEVKYVLETTGKREPDFNNLLKVLKGEKPNRPTLFEFFLNEEIYEELNGCNPAKASCTYVDFARWLMLCFRKAGYDYFTLPAPFGFEFKRKGHDVKKTISLNQSFLIADRDSFNTYEWPDADSVDCRQFDELSQWIIPGMKAIPYSPEGVLENVIGMLGYDNLCYLLSDDPDLVKDTFDRVGRILLRYYEIVMKYDFVGAAIVNDDWGFNSQTLMKVQDMRKYVVPWHKKIVEVIHKSGKPAILHSCGKLDAVMDDIIDVIGFDGKHSYEDKILPVEEAYEQWGSRIAILGGIDVNFICTRTAEEVYNRAAALLEQTGERNRYALGTGNSVPYYVPKANYYAMIMAALMMPY